MFGDEMTIQDAGDQLNLDASLNNIEVPQAPKVKRPQTGNRDEREFTQPIKSMSAIFNAGKSRQRRVPPKSAGGQRAVTAQNFVSDPQMMSATIQDPSMPGILNSFEFN